MTLPRGYRGWQQREPGSSGELIQGAGTGVADGYPPLIPVPCGSLYPVESGSAAPPRLWQSRRWCLSIEMCVYVYGIRSYSRSMSPRYSSLTLPAIAFSRSRYTNRFNYNTPTHYTTKMHYNHHFRANNTTPTTSFRVHLSPNTILQPSHKSR